MTNRTTSGWCVAHQLGQVGRDEPLLVDAVAVLVGRAERRAPQGRQGVAGGVAQRQQDGPRHLRRRRRRLERRLDRVGDVVGVVGDRRPVGQVGDGRLGVRGGVDRVGPARLAGLDAVRRELVGAGHDPHAGERRRGDRLQGLVGGAQALGDRLPGHVAAVRRPVTVERLVGVVPLGGLAQRRPGVDPRQLGVGGHQLGQGGGAAQLLGPGGQLLGVDVPVGRCHHHVVAAAGLLDDPLRLRDPGPPTPSAASRSG